MIHAEVPSIQRTPRTPTMWYLSLVYPKPNRTECDEQIIVIDRNEDVDHYVYDGIHR